MDDWWRIWRPRLILLYFSIALILVLISVAGHVRLLSAVGQTFGGFTWVADPDQRGQVLILSITPQSSFPAMINSIFHTTSIQAINGAPAATTIEQVYQQAQSPTPVDYSIVTSATTPQSQVVPTIHFTLAMWWQMYGLTLLAGLSWLLVGGVLLATASEWRAAVEGMAMFPPALLFLLYSHWGNIQQGGEPNLIAQVLWIPAFALLGASFIHLSLTYRARHLGQRTRPSLLRDVFPYLPLLALAAYEWSSLLLIQHVPLRIHLIVSLGYAVSGGLVSLGIGAYTLLQITGLWPGQPMIALRPQVRRRMGDLLTLWGGGVGLGFGLGVLPILLYGRPLISPPVFYTLATIFPLVLWYAIRSLRMLDHLHLALEEREMALHDVQQTGRELQYANAELRRTNTELQQATSLLLHADAHLRSLLSQRIHDQPRQQALRIRSLLGHWQHKIQLESEHDPEGQVAARPLVEALGKVRKISEELESDLRSLQMLVEDSYQRRSLGLKLHLEKLLREDLPLLHPESQLKVHLDLWALDVLRPDFEQTPEGEKIAEAISYAVTQALLNVYDHASATSATIHTSYTDGILEVQISDDGRGFDSHTIPSEKISLHKARLKAREAGGDITITSILRSLSPENHGTTITLTIPLPQPDDSQLEEPSSSMVRKEVKRRRLTRPI